jgi:hypothetical protein
MIIHRLNIVVIYHLEVIMVCYKNLEKYFTIPKVIKPVTKIPRRLKKKIKCTHGMLLNGLTKTQMIWYYLEYLNPDYKRFLIKQICNYYEI